ncbi:MAG: MltA domain-containing protein [Arcobacteraceae bacterium]
MKRAFSYSVYIFLLLIITGCTPKYEKFEAISQGNFSKISWNELEGFQNDDLEKAFEVFKIGCEKSARFDLLKQSCLKANEYESALIFFQENFVPHKLYDDFNKDEGLITGYYEPLLKGSRTKSKQFQYPVFKQPKDLIVVDLGSVYPELKKYRLRGKIVGNKLLPYDDRANMKEDEHKDAICYVDNKVDLFFLHIQGSGRVLLDSGEIINVGYANQNGRVYNSIGKQMMAQGLLKGYGASMQGMKKWFEDNPLKADEVLNHNESYVFFHESSKSATGSLGVPLVAKRNLAVDRNYIPLGLPVFIKTKNPVTKEDISKLMIAADTGGAIKGKIRADFYWGFGDEAGEIAGKMKELGKLYVLLPKQTVQ